MAPGIEPIHWGMVSIIAFELEYLSPPVALNHLFTYLLKKVVPPD
ncbi:MAG: C4-dicarboxylate transporter DctM subunit [Oleispira sp.]|jgi:C4-dicarboxylate transporter DctM subunit